MKIRGVISFILFALVMGGVSGCVTVGSKKLDDVGNYFKLREQQSTKSDVYASFGQPHDVRALVSGGSVWVYYKVHTRPSAWTFVPFVGLAAGGSARQTTFAYFGFDKAGVLEKVESKSDTDYENMWAGIGRGISRISNKSQADRVREEMEVIGKPFDQKLAKSVSAVRDK